MNQIKLDFEGGITGKYETFMEVVRHAYNESGRQKKSIAADLDISPSDLSRRLADNPNDTHNFNAEMLSDFIEACGPVGKDIVYWLVEKHLDDPDRARQERIDLALTVLEKVPEALEMLKTAQDAKLKAV